MAIDETAYERIARYVETAYPAARPVGMVRGVTRPRSFELGEGDQRRFFLTFVVDKLSSITHRCIEALEPGDRLLATTPDGGDVYEGELSEAVLAGLKSAEPDRDNGSHHVSPEALNSGQLIFRTRAGPLEIPVRVTSAGIINAPPGDFWARCAQLVELYPSRPPKISREAEVFRVSRQLGTMLERLAEALVPSAFWQATASVGQGQWADVPWCAVFDSRETTTAQKGVYPVIHFLTEPSPGIRIGLGVSITEYRDQARARSREVADQLTADAWDALARRGYERTPDLAASAQVTRLDYKRGMVFAKFVPLGEIRGRSEELSIDLGTALRVYKEWVDRDAGSAATLDAEQDVMQSHFGLDWLAQSTYWTPEAISEVLGAIQHRSPQIVLAGPPGTGKSWVAERLAEYLTEGRKERWRIVQFHPSYSYEQFVEGLRPVAKDGAIHFGIEPGHLRQFVRDMKGTDPHVLILDEMNRANLPRVLGELMYLFEYRDKAIDLSYTKDFKLPRNLLFIGTMNTADRSIRSIDIALRRRFDVFECRPDRGILERYYASEHSNTVPMLFEGFEALNGELERVLDRDRTIGHTFFMHSDMTPELLRRVWKHKVFPIIEEYLFDQPDVARTFTLGRFWTAI